MLRRSHLLSAVIIVAIGCAKVEPAHVPAEPTKAQPTASDAKPAEHRVEGRQVVATLRLSQAKVPPGEELEVAVEMKIAPMWEIHPLNSQPAEAATKLELVLPPGIHAAGEWSEPKTTRSMSASGGPVHMGKVVFTRTIEIDSEVPTGTHEIACTVSYQVCNERQCLKPETLTLSVPVAK